MTLQRHQLFLTGVLANVVTLLVIWRIPGGILLLLTLLLSWLLLGLAAIDIHSLQLPDRLTLTLLWSGLLSNASGFLPVPPLTEAVFGAVAGYSALFLLSKGYRLLRGKEGLGRGDAKLLAALGAWLGIFWLPVLMLMASAVALIALVAARLLSGRSLQQPFPFGPALALAGWVLFLWQNG
ncbi:A24 family peptidase [Pantoea sp. BAV 3049]|uniref:prepilin peptidase n=1 Tax=Pantoea sp. BAV 3049 TaxID=2654188 RepID=UPI00131A68C9|nr:A24 family peptidase [Pantoea sp. BAV 3049]